MWVEAGGVMWTGGQLGVGGSGVSLDGVAGRPWLGVVLGGVWMGIWRGGLLVGI